MAEAAESQGPPGPGSTYRTGCAGAAAEAAAPHEPERVPGASGVRLRRWSRGAVTVLLAALPVLAGVLAPAPAAQAASRASTAPSAPAAAGEGSGSRSADVSLNHVSPSVPKAGGDLTLSGTVTNNSRATIDAGRLDIRVGPTLNSRSAIEQASRRQGYLSGADGNAIGGGHAAKVGGLAPGISRPFTLKVSVSDLNLGPDGVYQLGVSLTGQTRARPYDQILGMGRTFLPWQKGDMANKSQLTYLWPLMSTPRLSAETESDEAQTPVFPNESLAKELAPGGRLQQMVALGDDLPITWVLDPDLIATVDLMSRRYRVQKENGKEGETVAGKYSEYASRWLNDLEKAVRGEEVVAVPFADPDLASLAHRGKNVPGALSHLGAATKLGRTTIETVLHVKPSTDFAWPYEGAVDSSIVDVATSAGARNVIARSDSVRDAGLSYSPTAARPIGSGNTALVSDARLSTAFEGDMSDAGAASQAVQQFVSQSLALAGQMPTRERGVVVAPQRMPSVSQAQAMAEGISALNGSGRWTQTARLAEAAGAKPDPGADSRVPSPRSYPASLRKSELPTSAFEQVRETKDTLDDFRVILSRADRVVPPFGNAIDREVSVAWRGHPKEAARFRDDVQSYLMGLKKRVHLIKKSNITLSGREATIPVTVQNNLFQRVDGLVLELRSSRIGLDVGESRRVVVDGGHSQSIKFDTTARNNGRAFVSAQLYTRDGKPYGQEMTFQVKVTSITSTVLLIIAGGVLLMVLAGIRMYTQRKRKGPAPDPDAPLETPEESDGSQASAARPATDDDTDGGGDDGDAGDDGRGDDGKGDGDSGSGGDGGHPGPDKSDDSTQSDTDQQNNNPPGTGEKVDR